ncbi:MAG: hypothetical protein LH616_07085 [Ilumatobacteraceae bacterium]|nr:hypothetical protein [Ilumatobacteraceae bacterium]
MLRSRRFAFAAAALLVGLSACGDSSPRTVAGNSPVVIQLGGGSSAGGGAEAASADKMMAYMQDITFVFDGDGSTVGAAGSAWTLPGGGTPDAARIAKLAELLGVEGELREVPADQGGGWMIGASDYSTATLMVSADGMLSWWFNPAPSTVVSSVECVYVDPAIDVVPIDTDAAATTAVDPAAATTAPPPSTIGGDATFAPPEGSCEAPLPPANVPDKAAAEAKAMQLFAEMGYDNTSYDYEVYADEWGANVTAYLLLDGMRSPISLSVGYGADSAVTYASGSLATPVPAGEYPLVGVDGGLVRLNDETGQWGGYWGSPMAMSRMEGTGSTEVVTASAGSAVAPPRSDTLVTAAAVTDTSVTDTAAMGEPGQVGEPISIDQPVCDPGANCEVEMPVLEPITVQLTDVKMGLTMIWAADNTIWLLPAYEFSADDGGQYTVIAVDDSFIQLPAPYPTDPMPVETMPVDSVEPADTVVVDDSQAVAEEVGKSIVGLPVDEAVTVAEAAGFSVRVTTLDGAPQDMEADFRTDRLNVSVENGVVVGIDSIG